MSDPATTPAAPATPWVDRLLFPFYTDAGPEKILRVLAASRVIFGVLLFHEYLDIYGFAPLAEAGEAALRARCLMMLGLSALLTVGLATPAVCVTLVVYFTYFKLTLTLGEYAAGLLSWGLLLTGAGRRYSVDALLMRGPRVASLFRWADWVSISLTPRNVALIRLLMMGLFYGICANAAVSHVRDDYWQNGQILPLTFTTPLYNDHYAWTDAMRVQYPVTFSAICWFGEINQMVWELFLIPLMYSRVGRVFVMLQGVVFFGLSIVFMNLHYLPLDELIMWLMLFGYVPLGELWRGPARPAAAAPPGPRSFGDRLLPWLVAVAFAVVTVHFVTAQLYPDGKWTRRLKRFHDMARPVYVVFGQIEVRVYGRSNVVYGNHHMVLHEVDGEGRHLRTAEFIDLEGGRLDGMRNSYLFFTIYLRWHQSMHAHKFVGGEGAVPHEYIRHMITRMARLDACLTDTGADRHYRAEFFERDVAEDERPYGWTGKRRTGTWDLTIPAADVNPLGPVYDLPPGQVGAAKRLQQTDEYLRTLDPPAK